MSLRTVTPIGTIIAVTVAISRIIFSVFGAVPLRCGRSASVGGGCTTMRIIANYYSFKGYKLPPPASVLISAPTRS
jgi:hypothetical protein